MDAHIQMERLRVAAERKLQLSLREWKHLEECRDCATKLTDAMREVSEVAVKNAA